MRLRFAALALGALAGCGAQAESIRELQADAARLKEAQAVYFRKVWTLVDAFHRSGEDETDAAEQEIRRKAGPAPLAAPLARRAVAFYRAHPSDAEGFAAMQIFVDGYGPLEQQREKDFPASELHAELERMRALFLREQLPRLPSSAAVGQFVERAAQLGPPRQALAFARAVLQATATNPAAAEASALLLARHEASNERQRPGREMPILAAHDLAGNDDSLANYRGKTVLLDFWATWCTSCKENMPALAALHEELKSRPFALISVSVDDNVQLVLDYQRRRQPMPWVNWRLPPDSAALGEWGVAGYPTYVLLDGAGKLLYSGNHIERGQVVEAVNRASADSPH